jgi:hypothetical protein
LKNALTFRDGDGVKSQTSSSKAHYVSRGLTSAFGPWILVIGAWKISPGVPRLPKAIEAYSNLLKGIFKKLLFPATVTLPYASTHPKIHLSGLHFRKPLVG